LRELGYIEGQNIIIERRSARGKAEQFPDPAADLVRLKVDAIVAHNHRAVVATQPATKTIPIAMAYPVDPVGTGLVPSLAGPGGNTMGLSLQLADVAGKRIQLLSEVVPSLRRLSVLWDPSFLGIQNLNSCDRE
jgi:putative ABC transport system substrate-binding protein